MKGESEFLTEFFALMQRAKDRGDCPQMVVDQLIYHSIAFCEYAYTGTKGWKAYLRDMLEDCIKYIEYEESKKRGAKNNE